MLTRWPQGLGPQEEPQAHGSRLDVHTELFVYVGVSRRSCQLFVYVGAPFGSNLGGGPEPLLYILLFKLDNAVNGIPSQNPHAWC